jgi:hypothetical protein
MGLSETQRAALRQIFDAIVDAVRAAGDHGAPGGVIYAGLSASGCTLGQFDSIMAALVRRGMLVRRGELYFIAT